MKANNSIALLTKTAIQDLFEQQGRSIKFKEGLSLDLYKNQVMVSLDLKSNDNKYKISILADIVEFDVFISQYLLKSLEQIQQISSEDLWLRYLAGHACICMEIFELEAEFCFRIVNGITIAYCRELHYYDEVYKILNIVNHFEKYVEENRSKLEFATERRWKW